MMISSNETSYGHGAHLRVCHVVVVFLNGFVLHLSNLTEFRATTKTKQKIAV